MHKFSINRLNLALLLPALLIVAIASASFYSIDLSIFHAQLAFLIISLLAYVVFLNIDYKVFVALSKPLYFLMVGSLLLLFLIGIEARGAVRWIDILGVRLQFSEIIKPFFIIFIAQFLAKDDSRSFKKFITALLLTFPIFFLTLKQPDLGNALVYLFTVLLMLFVYGFPFSYFIGISLPVILPFPIIFRFLHDYQKERILTFLNPTRDPFGSSYNVVQSLISIGSGGFIGKGFGQATQSILKFLPERHTDFIFATISESLGFTGAIFLVAIYVFLLFQIYKISLRVTDVLPRMIIMGVYFLLLTHIFLNIGMNIGIVPIVGITLPFASYGGSSLVTSFIMLGIVSSISFEHNTKHSMEIG